MKADSDIIKMQFYADKILKGYELNCKEIKYIIKKVQEDVLIKEPNVLNLSSPVYIVGGIGGNFKDLLSIFDIGGPLPHSTYLFLGNYSENNGFSINTVLLLFIYKYIYRENIYLIRGTNQNILKTKQVNEEERKKIPITSKNIELTLEKQFMYFFDQKDTQEIWELCAKAFDFLPIAAIISQLYFCVDSNFLLPGNNSLSIDYLSKINRTLPRQDKILISQVSKKFLSENKFAYLITGLNLANCNSLIKPPLYQIYSSPHTCSSDCYIIEINENKIISKIKKKPLKSKLDEIYTLPNEIFIY